MQVLRKLGHINQDDVVLLKGRAACEIDTADELLTTELMFNNTFNNLDKHQLVALVSCLVPVEKSNVSPASCWSDAILNLGHIAYIAVDIAAGWEYN